MSDSRGSVRPMPIANAVQVERMAMRLILRPAMLRVVADIAASYAKELLEREGLRWSRGDAELLSTNQICHPGRSGAGPVDAVSTHSSVAQRRAGTQRAART